MRWIWPPSVLWMLPDCRWVEVNLATLSFVDFTGLPLVLGESGHPQSCGCYRIAVGLRWIWPPSVLGMLPDCRWVEVNLATLSFGDVEGLPLGWGESGHPQFWGCCRIYSSGVRLSFCLQGNNLNPYFRFLYNSHRLPMWFFGTHANPIMCLSPDLTAHWAWLRNLSALCVNSWTTVNRLWPILLSKDVWPRWLFHRHITTSFLRCSQYNMLNA